MNDDPKLCTRDEIDASFAAMADDAEYQAEVAMLLREFALSDWEAFVIGEADTASRQLPS